MLTKENSDTRINLWVLYSGLKAPDKLLSFLFVTIFSKALKDHVFVPTLPSNLLEYKRTDKSTAVQSVEVDTFQSVWTELDYRNTVCRAVCSAHIEYFYKMLEEIVKRDFQPL